jgi:hypothetical protein
MLRKTFQDFTPDIAEYRFNWNSPLSEQHSS